MNELVLVRPAEGRSVIAPSGRKIEGIVKVDSSHPYWIRCLRSGDLVRVSKADAEKQASQKEGKE